VRSVLGSLTENRLIDWTLLARYAAPILAVFVGVALNRWFERRSRLVSYLAHTSAVTVRPQDARPFLVHYHSVVVRNAGKKVATNVRLGHNVLPDFDVYPVVEYRVADLPGGSREIIIPILVPGEQVTVGYLYFPPLLWKNINTHVKSDEGFAEIVTVLPTPQPARWVHWLAGTLIIIGLITVAMALGQFLVYVARHI
jgi:hypothetical protein